MCSLSRLRPYHTLYDPMCGSGTFLIEAALIATNTYPGIFRKSFAFERWKDFEPEMLDEIYNDDSQERTFNYKIYGSDISLKAIGIATPQRPPTACSSPARPAANG